MLELVTVSKNNFNWETFFETCWRQQPIHVKGGVELIMTEQLSLGRFHELRDSCRTNTKSRVSESPGEVIFIEKIDHQCAELKKVATQFVERIKVSTQVWLDSVWTSGAHRGIGSHFDDSDNFVLQQVGAKIWKLAAPTNLDPDIRLRRLAGEPGIGNCVMPEAHVELTLEEGDLLYIPSTWIHWGVSMEPSLSVSLVVNTRSWIDELLPALRKVASAEPVLGDAAHSFRRTPSSSEQSANVVSPAELAFKVLQRMTNPVFIQAVAAEWAESQSLNAVVPSLSPMSIELKHEDDPETSKRLTELLAVALLRMATDLSKTPEVIKEFDATIRALRLRDFRRLVSDLVATVPNANIILNEECLRFATKMQQDEWMGRARRALFFKDLAVMRKTVLELRYLLSGPQQQCLDDPKEGVENLLSGNSPAEQAAFFLKFFKFNYHPDLRAALAVTEKNAADGYFKLCSSFASINKVHHRELTTSVKDYLNKHRNFLAHFGLVYLNTVCSTRDVPNE